MQHISFYSGLCYVYPIFGWDKTVDLTIIHNYAEITFIQKKFCLSINYKSISNYVVNQNFYLISVLVTKIFYALLLNGNYGF